MKTLAELKFYIENTNHNDDLILKEKLEAVIKEMGASVLSTTYNTQINEINQKQK